MPNHHVLISKHGGKLGEGYSRWDMINSRAWQGRRKGQTEATIITDFCDTRTAILLCSFCQPRFNFRKNKYRAKFTADPSGLLKDGVAHGGMCDSCNERTENRGGGRLFIAEDYWEQVSQDPGEVRHRKRLGWNRRTWRERLFRRK